MDIWQVGQEHRSGLDRAGMHSFDALMFGDVGQPFKRKGSVEVYRIGLAGQVHYLKRARVAPWESVRRVLRYLRRGSPPHTETYRIHQSAAALRDAGFDVMDIVAWGDRRFLGVFPVCGFVVAREVEGTEASGLFENGSVMDRRRLLGAIGGLFARLHSRGLFLALRLSDLIVRPGNEPDAAYALTMIDLDFKGQPVERGAWCDRRAIDSLSMSYYYFARCGLRATAGEIRTLHRAYLSGVVAAGHRRPRAVLRDVRASVDGHLTGHFADPRRAAAFPSAPRPLWSSSLGRVPTRDPLGTAGLPRLIPIGGGGGRAEGRCVHGYDVGAKGRQCPKCRSAPRGGNAS